VNILTNPTNGVAVNLLVNPSEQERTALIKELVDYNQSKAGPRQFSQFGIFARGHTQELMGGLLGYISWKWLSIEVFWVAESARRLGVGGRLLHKAEEFALRQDCRFALVETYSFQARGFYEKHGYRLFAELENYPIGHECYYLRKTLAAGFAGFSADDIKRAGVLFAQKDKNLVVTWPQAKDVSASRASLHVQVARQTAVSRCLFGLGRRW
jgi:GNAT superfamily N-acetyltransferase